jgi:hypothetical protein
MKDSLNESPWSIYCSQFSPFFPMVTFCQAYVQHRNPSAILYAWEDARGVEGAAIVAYSNALASAESDLLKPFAGQEVAIGRKEKNWLQ